MLLLLSVFVCTVHACTILTCNDISSLRVLVVFRRLAQPWVHSHWSGEHAAWPRHLPVHCMGDPIPLRGRTTCESMSVCACAHARAARMHA